MRTQSIIGSLLALLLGTSALADQSGLAAADAFLRRQGAHVAARELSMAEKTSLGRALQTPNRTLDDHVIAGVLKNPVAWRPGPEGRELLRSIIHALPEVATVPGAQRSLSHATHPEPSNFRGFGFEAIATAALHRYREPNGDQPRVLRMSSDVIGRDGKCYESDGCVMFNGADSRQRLVTMKSVKSPAALRRSVGKAMSQLYLRNNLEPGERQPGILMLGYSDPAVLEAARCRDWRAAAERSGAKLLVLAVHQLTGQVTRLASETPSGTRPREPFQRRAPRMGPTGRAPQRQWGSRPVRTPFRRPR